MTTKEENYFLDTNRVQDIDWADAPDFVLIS